LAEMPPSAKTPPKLRHDLPGSDYGYVLNKCLEALIEHPTEREAEALLNFGPLWVDLIKRFELRETTERMAKLLGSQNMIHQLIAVEFLGAVEARQYAREIAKFLSPERDGLTHLAREVLLQWNSKELVPLLLKELKEGNDLQRYSAIEALGKCGDRTLLPVFLELGKDPHENNRLVALEAARTLIPADERMKLIVPLARAIAQNSKTPIVVDHALAVSIDCGDTEAIPAVMARLVSPDGAVRISIQGRLEEMSPRILTQAISAALLSKEKYGDSLANTDARQGLIGLLRQIGTPEVVPVLRAAAADPDPNVQYLAILVMGQIGAKDAVEDLVRALNGDWASTAAFSLALIRDRRALNELSQYLQRGGYISVDEVNQRYSQEFHRKLQATRLTKTIEAAPDELLATLAKDYAVAINVDVDAKEWMEASRRTGKVKAYQDSAVETSINSALIHMRRPGSSDYCYILRRNEVHVMRLENAKKFIIEMFNADFR